MKMIVPRLKTFSEIEQREFTSKATKLLRKKEIIEELRKTGKMPKKFISSQFRTEENPFYEEQLKAAIREYRKAEQKSVVPFRFGKGHVKFIDEVPSDSLMGPARWDGSKRKPSTMGGLRLFYYDHGFGARRNQNGDFVGNPSRIRTFLK